MNGTEPVALLLFCPRCEAQHVDASERDSHAWCKVCKSPPAAPCYEGCTVWQNPPHRSHKCHHCNYVWRPADVFTTGIEQLETRGANDDTADPRGQDHDAWWQSND